ncbi:hypothetical protein C1I97_03890 [Streptomyces sp. NTH33]|nr:hypothetical protein C1I97_03890 [Streptomyces sp. NTH33]
MPSPGQPDVRHRLSVRQHEPLSLGPALLHQGADHSEGVDEPLVRNGFDDHRVADGNHADSMADRTAGLPWHGPAERGAGCLPGTGSVPEDIAADVRAAAQVSLSGT